MVVGSIQQTRSQTALYRDREGAARITRRVSRSLTVAVRLTIQTLLPCSKIVSRLRV